MCRLAFSQIAFKKQRESGIFSRPTDAYASSTILENASAAASPRLFAKRASDRGLCVSVRMELRPRGMRPSTTKPFWMEFKSLGATAERKTSSLCCWRDRCYRGADPRLGKSECVRKLSRSWLMSRQPSGVGRAGRRAWNPRALSANRGDWMKCLGKWNLKLGVAPSSIGHPVKHEQAQIWTKLQQLHTFFGCVTSQST